MENIFTERWILRGTRWTYGTSAKRDGKAAARSSRQILGAKHTKTPRVITVDKNAAYPVAINELKADQMLKAETKLRQKKYLNNIIEQHHQNVKRIVKPMTGFNSKGN